MDQRLAISGVSLGTTEEQLIRRGWRESGRMSYPSLPTTVVFECATATAFVEDGAVVEVFGHRLELDEETLLESGTALDSERQQLFVALSYEIERHDLDQFVHSSRHQRFNFEGRGLAVIVNDDKVGLIILHKGLLAVDKLRGKVFGYFLPPK